ncbi:hypothetical protein V2K64_10455 [Pseudomonas alliivorans]|nr:hypothetical protein [Pseudomonas alliivorans]MEE4889171.1 hypothetical protein [Pseudomonas alliivorans]
MTEGPETGSYAHDPPSDRCCLVLVRNAFVLRRRSGNGSQGKEGALGGCLSGLAGQIASGAIKGVPGDPVVYAQALYRLFTLFHEGVADSVFVLGDIDSMIDGDCASPAGLVRMSGRSVLVMANESVD